MTAIRLGKKKKKGHLFAKAGSSQCVPLDVRFLLQVDLHKVALGASISTKAMSLLVIRDCSCHDGAFCIPTETCTSPCFYRLRGNPPRSIFFLKLT